MKGKFGSALSLLSLVVFCSSTVIGASADKVLLRHKWVPGEELMGKFHIEGETQFENRHKWEYRRDPITQESKPEKAIIRDYDSSSFTTNKEQLTRAGVLSVDDEGKAIVSMEIQTVALREDKAGAERETGPGEWMGPIKVSVSELGELKEIDPGALKKFYQEKVSAPRLIEPIMLRLPVEKVGVGDTWKGPGRVVSLLVTVPDIAYEVTYCLEEFQDIEGRQCAIISSKATIKLNLIEGDWSLSKSGAERKAILKDMVEEFSNEYIFDIEAGRVIKEKGSRKKTAKRLFHYRKGEKEWWWEEDMKSSAYLTSELVKDKTSK